MDFQRGAGSARADFIGRSIFGDESRAVRKRKKGADAFQDPHGGPTVRSIHLSDERLARLRCVRGLPESSRDLLRFDEAPEPVRTEEEPIAAPRSNPPNIPVPSASGGCWLSRDPRPNFDSGSWPGLEVSIR